MKVMNEPGKKLTSEFFERSPVVVAQDLLGKVVSHTVGGQTISGIITETEAYGGQDDPASHSYGGLTKRNWPMYGDAGLIYVYLSYGIHHCFNVSVGKKGEVGAVLIRSLLLLPDRTPITGPGRSGKAMKLTPADTGIQSVADASLVSFTDIGERPTTVDITPRVGISKAKEKLWRFVGVFS